MRLSEMLRCILFEKPRELVLQKKADGTTSIVSLI